MKSTSNFDPARLLNESLDAIRVVCVSSQSDTQDLVRKFSHFRDLNVTVEFCKSLNELAGLRTTHLDIAVIEVRSQSEEQQFFKLLHQGDFAQTEIIVLCSGADAKEWHTWVMEREISDYMVMRPLYDPHHLRIQLRQSMERCSLNRLLGLVEGTGQTNDSTQSGLMSNSPFALFQAIVRLAQARPDSLTNLSAVGEAVEQLQRKSVPVLEQHPGALLTKKGPHSQFVLLIEDDLATAQIVKEILISEGYTVVHFISYDKACREDFGMMPDVCVVDLNVPGTQGAEGVKKLQAKLAPANVPIIIASAHSELDVVKELATLNVEAYLVKPIVRASLVARVHEVLNRRTVVAVRH